METRPMPETEDACGRREFLLGLGAATVGMSAAGGGAAEAPPAADAASQALPSIALGPHRISRLVLGGNPVYGYSHFNGLYSRHLIDYHTPERVVELVRSARKAGITVWQNSWAERTVEDVERCRAAGIDFRWLLLGNPDWDRRPELVEEAARRKPIGIAPHGSLAERLHRAGKVDDLKSLLRRIRSAGVLVGLSAHDPAIIARAEEEGWDVDYYMCCLYYLTRPREELKKAVGEIPLGEVYLPSDREKMLRAVRAARKPCLVYKVLAAGRLDLSQGEVRKALQETLAAIKPTDGMIVGMFQEFGDQLGENARAVREAAAPVGG